MHNTTRDLATKDDIAIVRGDIDKVREGVGKLGVELEHVKKGLEDVGDRLERVERNMESVEKNLERVERNIERVEKNLERVEKNMVTREDLERVEKNMVTKEEAKRFATKEDLQAAKEEIKREIHVATSALGARWGLMSEDVFREGMREILKEAGWAVEKEYVMDVDGYVYGAPQDVEYVVVVKDGKVILVEIAASIRRGDIQTFVRKRELYERTKGVKVEKVYVITPYIHDRDPDWVRVFAKKNNIHITYPTPEVTS
ncbi:MAG: DUF3782 domain-containing protein [Pyrobaculum sp.]